MANVIKRSKYSTIKSLRVLLNEHSEYFHKPFGALEVHDAICEEYPISHEEQASISLQLISTVLGSLARNEEIIKVSRGTYRLPNAAEKSDLLLNELSKSMAKESSFANFQTVKRLIPDLSKKHLKMAMLLIIKQM